MNAIGLVRFEFKNERHCAGCFRRGVFKWGWRMVHDNSEAKRGRSNPTPTPFCDDCARQRGAPA